MNRIGVKLYYDKNTGEVIFQNGEAEGIGITETTFEQDVEILELDKDRSLNDIGIMKFEFGEFYKLMGNNNSIKIDLETLKPIFYNIEIEKPTEEQLIKERLELLEKEKAELLTKMMALSIENN